MPPISSADVAIISPCYQIAKRRLTRAWSAFATARGQRERSHRRRVIRQQETRVWSEKNERERDALRVYTQATKALCTETTPPTFGRPRNGGKTTKGLTGSYLGQRRYLGVGLGGAERRG